MGRISESSSAGKSGGAEGGGKRAKSRYRAPTLTVYGSVRELTGSFTPAGGGDGGPKMTAAPPSDAACKENVVRIGEHPSGYGLYLFDFKPEFRDAFGHGRQFGVMAQEVERIVPGAVTIAADGYRRVDYARLGIVRH